jgi:hypothetical protein
MVTKKSIVWEFNLPRVGLDYYDNEGTKISVERDKGYKEIFDKFVQSSGECYLSLQHGPTYEFYDVPLSELGDLFLFHGYENGRPIVSIVGSREVELTSGYKRKISKALKENGCCELDASGFGSNSLLLSFDDDEFPSKSASGAVVVREI